MKTWKTISVVTATLISGALGSLSSGSAEEGKSIEQMIAEAKTPADHQAIAALYQQESARLQREAAQHAELGQWWTSLAGSQSLGSARYEQAEHCLRFADLLEKTAQEAQNLANGHESIAQSMGGGK